MRASREGRAERLAALDRKRRRLEAELAEVRQADELTPSMFEARA